MSPPVGSDGPEISVLMSTYNRASVVADAVASVLAQQSVRFEFLIIDDCSDDGTWDALQSFSDHPQVRLIRNPANRGLPASLNLAIGEACAPLLARMDDDDEWTDPLKLRRQLDWFQSHPDGVLLGTGYRDERGETVHNPETDQAIRKQMLKRCPFCHPSVVLSKAAVLAVGAYDEALPYAEDWELWMRLGQQGTLGNLPVSTLAKREVDETLSRRYFHRQLGMAIDLVKRHGAAYPGRFSALAMHRLNRLFFQLFPIGGAVHRFMAGVYRRVFRLDAGADRR